MVESTGVAIVVQTPVSETQFQFQLLVTELLSHLHYFFNVDFVEI